MSLRCGDGAAEIEIRPAALDARPAAGRRRMGDPPGRAHQAPPARRDFDDTT
ncbi:hypothetical protein ABZY34_24500 [Streptomyces virginiae]|uniref:hypothetical protein n=1 Tax=Streptomyces virginiae TaxID=1961 RepID=UPI0033B911AC